MTAPGNSGRELTYREVGASHGALPAQPKFVVQAGFIVHL